MKGKLIKLGLLLCTLVSMPVLSIELVAKTQQQSLMAQIREIHYPSHFIDKEVRSGLPNQVTLWAALFQGDEQLFGVQTELKITFDLWDEVYLVESINSQGHRAKHTLKDKSALQKHLLNLTAGPLVRLNGLKANQRYELKAQVIVNPVKSERIKKIQAWLATSKGFTPPEQPINQNTSLMRSSVTTSKGDVTPSTAGVRSSGPRFKKLFDQILEQYIDGDEIPALWRSDVLSLEINQEQLFDASKTD